MGRQYGLVLVSAGRMNFTRLMAVSYRNNFAFKVK